MVKEKPKSLCPVCGKPAKCSFCKRKLKEGDFIICYREGIKHFCSNKCMLAYFKKYSDEAWVVLDD